MELPTALHLEIWAKGIQQMLAFGRYPALLVSRHYTGLRRDRAVYNSPAALPNERDFLETQARLQAELIQSLRGDPHYAPWCAEEVLERNSRLLAVWDWLSLLLCMGLAEVRRIPKVPAAQGILDLTLRPEAEAPTRTRVSPWPFRAPSVKLVAEGRHLRPTSRTEPQMRAALQTAPRLALALELLPPP
jgi:hypothetical protein